MLAAKNLLLKTKKVGLIAVYTVYDHSICPITT
jgi:hypothetical protein